MTKKLMTWWAALALILGLGAATAPAEPAQAYYTNPAPCVVHNSVKTCVSVDWERQSDGTGVRLNAFAVSTPMGCVGMESPALLADWAIHYPNNGGSFYGGSTSDGCSFQRFPYKAGPPEGNIDVKIRVKVRKNLSPDHFVHFHWTLWPSGGVVLNSAYATSA